MWPRRLRAVHAPPGQLTASCWLLVNRTARPCGGGWGGAGGRVTVTGPTLPGRQWVHALESIRAPEPRLLRDSGCRTEQSVRGPEGTYVWSFDTKEPLPSSPMDVPGGPGGPGSPGSPRLPGSPWAPGNPGSPLTPGIKTDFEMRTGRCPGPASDVHTFTNQTCIYSFISYTEGWRGSECLIYGGLCFRGAHS